MLRSRVRGKIPDDWSSGKMQVSWANWRECKDLQLSRRNRLQIMSIRPWNMQAKMVHACCQLKNFRSWIAICHSLVFPSYLTHVMSDWEESGGVGKIRGRANTFVKHTFSKFGSKDHEKYRQRWRTETFQGRDLVQSRDLGSISALTEIIF